MIVPRGLRLLLVLVVLAGAVLAFHNWRLGRAPEWAGNGYAGAEEAVAQLLIAIKHDDQSHVAGLLYSRCAEARLLAKNPERVGKMVSQLRRKHALDTVSDLVIRRSVKAVPGAKQELIVSILQLSMLKGYPAEWLTWDADMPTMVKYEIRGMPMVSVALRENGDWKVAGLPLVLSAKVLKYRTVQDANAAADALVEPAGE